MPVYRDVAVVLRTRKLAEADRIVTLLTKEHGIVRAVAKGVRRTSSKFGARLEPFSFVDLQLAQGRNLDIVTQAVSKTAFGAKISTDYDRFTSGTAMLETAERLVSEEREPSPEQFLLLVAALRALTDGTKHPTDVLDSYLLRSLSIAGYAPSFSDCARCNTNGPHRFFHPAHGGVLCQNCRLPGSVTPANETITHLAALRNGAWDEVQLTTEKHRKEAGNLITAYLTWHLERGLRSISYVTRIS